jgi:hypothetical protein
MPNMQNVSNVSYLNYMTYTLIVAGYLVTMFSPESSIAGYSCVVAGLFFYMMLQVVPLTQQSKISFSMFLPFLPIIIVLGVVIWILSINVKYFKKIDKGIVTPEYKTFNTLAFFLLLIQLGLLSRRNSLPYATTLISLVVSFQIIVVFIMQMNLEYFITDG